jgi:hypothetical protein
MDFHGLNDPREALSYEIWGTVVASSIFICGATIKVDENNNRVYIALELIPIGKYLKKLHAAWILRVNEKIKPLLPEGFRTVIYVKQ